MEPMVAVDLDQVVGLVGNVSGGADAFGQMSLSGSWVWIFNGASCPVRSLLCRGQDTRSACHL